MLQNGEIISSGNPKNVLNGEKLKEVYDIDIKSFMVNVLNKWEDVI